MGKDQKQRFRANEYKLRGIYGKNKHNKAVILFISARTEAEIIRGKDKRL